MILYSKKSVSSLYSHTLRLSSTPSNSSSLRDTVYFLLKERSLCWVTCTFPCCASSSTLSTDSSRCHPSISWLYTGYVKGGLAVSFRMSATCWILLLIFSIYSAIQGLEFVPNLIQEQVSFHTFQTSILLKLGDYYYDYPTNRCNQRKR